MSSIDKYEILGKIGEGGMGIVQKARDTTIGRLVAIKSVHGKDVGSPEEQQEFMARLIREAQAAGKLSHPNIVTIYAWDPLQSYIVMEFVEGMSLAEWLPDIELWGPHTVLDVIRQSAAALDYAHTQGVVHRDVKPSNILIRRDGQVKLVDFGLAKLAQAPRLSQSNAQLGTPHYMSAEQISGTDQVTALSDQYSLAVCAFEMMAGAKPFTGQGLQNLFYNIMNSLPTSVTALNPTLSAAVETVLAKALAPQVERRFRTCLEFSAALDRACALTPAWRPRAVQVSRPAPVVVRQQDHRPPVAELTPPPTPIYRGDEVMSPTPTPGSSESRGRLGTPDSRQMLTPLPVAETAEGGGGWVWKILVALVVLIGIGAGVWWATRPSKVPTERVPDPQRQGEKVVPAPPVIVPPPPEVRKGPKPGRKVTPPAPKADQPAIDIIPGETAAPAKKKAP